MIYERLKYEEAGGVLKRLEDWIIDKIPALRRGSERTEASIKRNSTLLFRSFEDMEPETQAKILQDKALRDIIAYEQREAGRRHANY